MSRETVFRLGLIVNPLAGVGGAIAQKGSDAISSLDEALALGATPRAQQRSLQALRVLQGLPIEIITWSGSMGDQVAREAGFAPLVLGAKPTKPTEQTSGADTERAARALQEYGVDLLLFAGGDGTARNICNAVDKTQPVLGIPAGVKIHSGVYAVTPGAAGEVVAQLVRGELVSFAAQEVRDIDEAAFRQGRVRAKYYGELCVPCEHRYVQAVKASGTEVEALVLDDIAAGFAEQMRDDVRYIMGSGSTVAAIMDYLGLDNTLLGVDVIENGELLASDCTAQQLLALSAGHETQLVITPIGGQGHIIGRGNQQLSPELLMRIGRNSLHLVATKAKLKALQGRPLIVDSGDIAVNQMLSGVLPVQTGYADSVLYRVASY